MTGCHRVDLHSHLLNYLGSLQNITLTSIHKVGWREVPHLPPPSWSSSQTSTMRQRVGPGRPGLTSLLWIYPTLTIWRSAGVWQFKFTKIGKKFVKIKITLLYGYWSCFNFVKAICTLQPQVKRFAFSDLVITQRFYLGEVSMNTVVGMAFSFKYVKVNNVHILLL